MGKRTKRWTKEETKVFLHFYAGRKEEFTKNRKKRFAYANILEDIISAGFDSGFTPRNLEVKMQTLLRVYNDAKDNSSKTGASPCTVPFWEEMEDLFGDKPIHSKAETINFGSENFTNAPVLIPTSPDMPSTTSRFPETHAEASPTLEYFAADTDSNTASASNAAALETETNNVIGGSAAFVGFSATASFPGAAPVASVGVAALPSTRPAKIKTRRTAMSRSDYYKEKLKQRQREMKAAEERFQQRQRDKAQLELQKAESRKTKFELIEKFLNK
ncbi:uncharacterized protein LOC129947752 [Eupeodes corollae]|uniref:uncharacterized protein LOC129947752 n=1 Tax=Eupeodes corollae TaxID=290404 RepID=UPI0024909D51|nr:uncharacterized protein LOC129947752 [Eupeodes corollae]